MKKQFYWSFERGDLLPFLLILPTLLLITFVMIIPLFFGTFISFFDFSLGGFDLARDFLGFDNYVRFFNDATAIKSMVVTVLFSIGAISGDLFFGTVAAVLIFRLSRKASSILRPIITMPLLVSPIIVGLIWRYIYDPQGILYWFLGLFGLGIKDFPGVTSQSTALISIIIAHWWQVTPFVIIILTAGLVSIPHEYYEAAYVDGAGAFRAFQKITLPFLSPMYMVILLISGVDTIKIFDIIYALTGGGPNNSTMSVNIYAFNQGFVNTNMSYASTISLFAMLLAFLLFGLPFIRNNRIQHEEYK
ncbi:MAG: sugar ABC transporter permease [Vallitaleaceae bacterium]|nr:sugar ABC transporter permease [Vallitaleaceae bacterium]